MSFPHDNSRATTLKTAVEPAGIHAPDERRQPPKLNIFQRGILQRCATTLVYLASITLGAFFLDWLDKWFFTRLAKSAQQQGVFSPEATRRFITLIEARDGTVMIFIVLVGLACGLAVWVFMRWAAKRNWSWPVTLPAVVEFRSAMERLGVIAPDERIHFVRKHNVPVFIAPRPLVGLEHKDVRARLYVFAHHSLLGSEAIFERRTGSQTLCLDATDYERLLEEYGPKTRSAYSVRIAELERNVIDLKAVNSLQSADIAKLTERNKNLSDENAEYRKKQQTAPGRKGAAEKRENDRASFWRVAGPLVNRLIAEAKPETEYNRPQIQAAFLEELEKFPELKPVMKKLLATGKKEADGTPYELEGWGMEAIRSALGDFAQTEPRAPKKTEKY